MLGHSSGTATAPAVYPTFPPRDFFKFFPEPEPQVLQPPAADYTFARPFQIDPEFYNNTLSFAVPATIAVVYATTVTILNQVNRRRSHKPWAVSKSLPFLILVVTHNVFLALYSAWTCWGMLRQTEFVATDLASCGRDDMYVGRYTLYVASDLDVCAYQFWSTCVHGESDIYNVEETFFANFVQSILITLLPRYNSESRPLSRKH